MRSCARRRARRRVRRPPRPRRAASATIHPVEQHGDVPVLRRDRRVEGGEGRGIRPHGERRHERRCRTSTPGSGRKTVPVSNSARSVSPRATLRCATRSRPGTRLRRRNGACPSSGFASLTLGRCVTRGGAVQVVLLLGRERERGRLDVARGGERVADAASALLRRGQAATRRRRRQDRRDAVVPLDAGDLFGERPLVGEVGAPGRRRDDRSSSPRSSTSQPISRERADRPRTSV